MVVKSLKLTKNNFFNINFDNAMLLFLSCPLVYMITITLKNINVFICINVCTYMLYVYENK